MKVTLEFTKEEIDCVMRAHVCSLPAAKGMQIDTVETKDNGTYTVRLKPETAVYGSFDK